MPRIWLDYCDFLVQQRLLTRARLAYDEALRALPITQHDRVWEPYLKFVHSMCPVETAVRVHRRFLKLHPDRAEDYIDFLVESERFDEAALRLAGLINDATFQSRNGKTQHQMWVELTDMCSRHARHVRSIKVDPIIRSGIVRFSDNLGHLWTSLASYYTRLGQFDKARDVYEEAITSVHSARDFSQIFDAYAEFEETIATSQMDAVARNAPGAEAQLSRMMARIESILDRRPFLMNEVLLRQNPNNVHEWLKRARLFATMPRSDPAKVAAVFNQALEAVNPKEATGHYSHLWISYALYYENGCTMPEKQQLDEASGVASAPIDDGFASGSKRKRDDDDHDGKGKPSQPDLQRARAVFERAVKAPFRRVEELAGVWCAYGEMELRQGCEITHYYGNFANYACRQPKRALTLMARATTPVKRNVNFYDEVCLFCGVFWLLSIS